MAVFDWSRSGCEIVKTEFEWNVQVPFLQVSEHTRTPPLLSKSFFYAKETPDHQWNMRVHGLVSYLQISMHHYNSKKQETQIGDPAVLVKFALVDRQGQKGFQQMLPSHPNSKYVQFGLRKENVINSKCQLADGSHTFYCKIQSFVKVESDERNPEFSYAKPINCSDQLITQLEGLLSDTTSSDVTFVLREREFPAHKAILAFRSKVFEAMFKHPIKENLTNRVAIEDIEPDVFGVLLHFIYTGRVSLAEMRKFAVGLYAAADKYMLDQLQTACENHLLRRPMTADNCFEMLLFTSEHSVEQLKQDAIKFFRVYPVEVMETQGWKRAMTENLPWVKKMLKFLLHPADMVDDDDQVKEEPSSKKMRMSEERGAM